LARSVVEFNLKKSNELVNGAFIVAYLGEIPNEAAIERVIG